MLSVAWSAALVMIGVLELVLSIVLYVVLKAMGYCITVVIVLGRRKMRELSALRRHGRRVG